MKERVRRGEPPKPLHWKGNAYDRCTAGAEGGKTLQWTRVQVESDLTSRSNTATSQQAVKLSPTAVHIHTRRYKERKEKEWRAQAKHHKMVHNPEGGPDTEDGTVVPSPR